VAGIGRDGHILGPWGRHFKDPNRGQKEAAQDVGTYGRRVKTMDAKKLARAGRDLCAPSFFLADRAFAPSAMFFCFCFLL
jgi:hypothetical protein